MDLIDEVSACLDLIRMSLQRWIAGSSAPERENRDA